ncbi:hypothetical protein ONE63_003403 [Megalurothrips usitatus]|uniref:Uncharacterized protein n=1 Tax=Megalurothrips usitatus TaxID=439358 RepID=A0AAV7XBF0_9NEOP|nr:hypothetical protein ONE63_003403 [Megalurothrips usitatus]
MARGLRCDIREPPYRSGPRDGLGLEKLVPHVTGAKTVYQTWYKLVAIHEDKGTAKRLGLVKRLIQMKQKGDLKDYVPGCVSHVNKIKESGKKLADDGILVSLLFQGVKQEHESNCATLEHTRVHQTFDHMSGLLMRSPVFLNNQQTSTCNTTRRKTMLSRTTGIPEVPGFRIQLLEFWLRVLYYMQALHSKWSHECVNIILSLE